MPGGTIDRRYYELCVLSELRDRLRAGDVWVTGSRQYRSYEERLISSETLENLRQSGGLPIAVEADFDTFIAARRILLDERMTTVDARAAEGKLPDVTLTKGVLKISPIEKSTPPEAEVLAARLYAMLPRIRITDLLAEVATWTLFPDCFTHLRTGETAADNHILMAGLLADGLNLGLTRMAEACSIGSLGQLAWTSDWHIRDETYVLALRCLVNQQQREPFAAHFGGGMASSSDGQFFQAAGYGRAAADLNAHYGHKPGFKAYTHLSDRYSPFYTKLIAATASEALHVLDALLYHQSEVATRRHHTDGGGDSDHVFALCTLVGLQFAPRIPDLKHRRLYSFGKPSAYPALEPMIAGRINVELIRAHWSEILRIIASIRTGTVTASLIMRQLASYPRQNGLAAALRELGRMERTLFMYVTWNRLGLIFRLLGGDMAITASLGERWPILAREPTALAWLAIRSDLGLAPRTLDAYSRGLSEYLVFCATASTDPLTAGRDHIARYVRELTQRPPRRASANTVPSCDASLRLANATVQQRLTAVRLFYDHLVEEGVRDNNPVGRGRYAPSARMGGNRRGLVPHQVRLPWIPDEADWRKILNAARREPIRNRMMLALAYDAGLRREELVLSAHRRHRPRTSIAARPGRDHQGPARASGAILGRQRRTPARLPRTPRRDQYGARAAVPVGVAT